jgi:O-antigen ligase
MNRKINIIESVFKNYGLSLLLLFSFSIPLWQKFSTIVLVLLAVLSMLKIKKFKFNSLVIPMLLLYFMYVFCEIMFHPVDFSIVEMKASLLVLPIIFMLNNYDHFQIKKALKYFIYGVVVPILACYVNAFVNAITLDGGFSFNTIIKDGNEVSFLQSSIHGNNYFFGNNFSIFHQSAYFSMHLNIAVAILLFCNVVEKKIAYFILFFISIVLFQVSNRVNIILFFILLVIGLFLTIKNRKNKIISIIASITIALLFVFINPRINNLYNKFTNSELTLEREANDSFGLRLLVWDASLTVIKSNIMLGVGPSNSYNSLKRIYKEKRYVFPFRERLNSHNQFLQIFVECGIFGFLIFLIFLINNYIKNNYLSVLFILIISFNALFESVLNRYSGIVCISFISCCLLFQKGLTKKHLISPSKE